MKRRNILEAFIGEPDGGPFDGLDNYADGDEAVAIDVRGGKLMLVVPAGTSDADLFDRQSFLGGELTLEDGRVLSFQIQEGSVGALASIGAHDERDRPEGMSSIPDIPSGS